MESNSVLKLLNYKVNQIHFDLNSDFDGKEFNVKPTFKKEINKIDADKAKVVLKIAMNSTKEAPAPFTLQIIISGIFELKDWENSNSEIMKVNTVAILFPFLRSLLATVTCNAAVPPYVLPVLNINALLDDND
ncbi:MAG: protein-export chaperone SecB [Clostridia bacterium]|nr:protein-export chaperone SecB [Clostridia bacterium]